MSTRGREGRWVNASIGSAIFLERKLNEGFGTFLFLVTLRK